ncbi:MAG: hypothetical protein RRY02_09315, partial [Muribaculaceae bacterium]
PRTQLWGNVLSPSQERRRRSTPPTPISKLKTTHYALTFGFMEQSMPGIKCECVGIVRATGILGLMNLTYNLFRDEQIIRLDLLAITQ